VLYVEAVELGTFNQRIAIAIAPAIGDAEQRRAMRKPPASLDAWAAYQRGLWHFGNDTAEDNALAKKFFQQAVDLDESFAGGYKGLSTLQGHEADYVGRGLPETLGAAEGLACRAVALDGADAEARSLLAIALHRRGDNEVALAEAARALTISPNLAGAHSARGASLISSGRHKEGIAALERSIRLDPCRAAVRLNQIALALLLFWGIQGCGRCDEPRNSVISQLSQYLSLARRSARR
jgi:adenylate cyclase